MSAATSVATRRDRSAAAAASAIRRKSKGWSGMPRIVWLLIVPFLLFFTATTVVPIVYTFVQSFFTEKSAGGLGLGTRESVYAGLDNYADVIGSAAFWSGMARVLLFGVIQVPIMVIFALTLSLILDTLRHRYAQAFQLAYFLPYAVPGVIAALLWAYLYVPEISPIVQGLQAIGVPADFLAPGTVLWSMANISIWSWTGYNMIIFVAALQAVPKEQYEAAKLDGAGEFRLAWSIKLPGIRTAVGLSVLMSIIGTIQLFNEPIILKTVSSTIDSEFVPMMMAYNAAFTAGDTGLASAIAVTIAVVAGALVYVYYVISTGGLQRKK